MTLPRLDPDRLFPADPATRAIARALHGKVSGRPILSPHDHADPTWFASDVPFSDAAWLLAVPDPYGLRRLASRDVPLSALGGPTCDGSPYQRGPRRMANLRRALPPVARHAGVAMARPGIRRGARPARPRGRGGAGRRGAMTTGRG